MGIKGWYLSGSEKAKSSYTEFNTTENNRPESSYTDFTMGSAARQNNGYANYSAPKQNGYRDFSAARQPGGYTDYSAVRQTGGYTDFSAAAAGGYNGYNDFSDFTAFGEDESFESAPVRKPAKTKAAKAPKAKAARPAKVKSKKVKVEKAEKVKAEKAKKEKPAKAEKVKAEKVKPAKAEKTKPEKIKDAKTKPIKKRAVRQAEVDFEPAYEQPKKKSKVKAFLCAFGALTVVVAAGAYAGNYFGIIDIGEFLSTLDFFETNAEGAEKEQSKSTDKEDALGDLEALSEKATKKMIKTVAVDKSHLAYEVAENILYDLRCDNDVDTAYNIFDWVHSNILYQTIFEDQSYEDAAYMGFTRRSGDCYVYFSCAKMLLDCAGIPNIMVTRYPVVTNGHYWNLVQLNGEWYHCDATVFRDHYDMYFMCTDDEIDDGHHDFDHSLYPERASGYSGYQEDWWGVDPDAYNDPYTDDWSDDDWNEWSDDDWSDDDWNGLTEEDYYNIDVQYDNANNGYSGELDENVNVYEDDFEDDWN